MCGSSLHTFLAAMPKCEHHVHLEGTLEPSLLFELAARNSIPLPNDPAFESQESLHERYGTFMSFSDFLTFYSIGITTLIHERDFAELAMNYFVRAQQDGVKHAEVFFDIQAHTLRGVTNKVVIDGLKAACQQAEVQFGMTVLLIACFQRHLPLDDAVTNLEAMKADLASGLLSGISLDAYEKDFPPNSYAPVYMTGKTLETRTTTHGGEDFGHSELRETLDLHFDRIGHGLTILDSESMKEVADLNLLVTLCPLSNLKMRYIPALGNLPISYFLSRGVKFSINSDNPAYLGHYILDNYCAVQETFDLSLEDWQVIGTNAIDGSWCSNERKAQLHVLLEQAVENFQNS